MFASIFYFNNVEKSAYSHLPSLLTQKVGIFVQPCYQNHYLFRAKKEKIKLKSIIYFEHKSS